MRGQGGGHPELRLQGERCPGGRLCSKVYSSSRPHSIAYPHSSDPWNLRSLTHLFFFSFGLLFSLHLPVAFPKQHLLIITIWIFVLQFRRCFLKRGF